MRRAFLTFAAASLALAAVGAPAATAHELTVLEPGPAELDLGTVSVPRLVHATLVKRDDTLLVRVHPDSGDLIEVQLLVPAERSESERRPTAVPRMRAAAALANVAVLQSPTLLVDEVTGVSYRLLARSRLRQGEAQHSITVRRGAQPVRVALRLAPARAPFAASSPERTPRTLVRLRDWQRTAPDGSRPGAVAEPVAASRFAPWFAGALGAGAMLLAAWWMRSGRRSSRERGLERLEPLG